MDIMTQFLERNNIDVPYFARREKSVDPQGHCNTVQFKGNDAHALVSRIKYVYDVSDFHTHFDTSESEISFPPLEKIPISLLEPSPLNTSFLPLVYDLSSSESFKIRSYYSLYDLEYYFQADMKVMTHLSHPFDTQNTLQLPNSLVGKLDNFMVSYTISLVKLVIMSLFSIIGWF